MVRPGLKNTKTDNLVPLKGISVTSTIKDFVAEVSIAQKYQNNEDNPIETLFVFPLDSQSAVISFEVFMKGKKLVGKIEGKARAQQIYNKAISEGKTAVKMDQEDEGETFTMKVGNLPAKAFCVVTLKYVTQLKMNTDKTLEFLLPQTVAPHFIQMEKEKENENEMEKEILKLSSKENDLEGIELAEKVPYGTAFNFSFNMRSDIKEITCNTHEITPKLNKHFGSVTIRPKEKEFGKDVVLNIKLTKPHQPGVQVGISPIAPEKEKQCAMLTFFPDLEDCDVKTELIFLIDRSGSMSGRRIANVRDLMNIFLHSLPDTCKFNIIGFGSSYKTLFKESVEYNEETLQQAKDHSSKMQANLGGTNILRPLEFIFKTEPARGYARQIFLLTDGEVSNTQSIISNVRSQSNTTRVFTFGIGHGASKALVSGVAKAGRGDFEIITDDDNLRSKVLRQLNKALQASITNLELKWGGDIGVPTLLVPNRLPPLFAGSRMIFYAFLPENVHGGVELSGEGPDGPVSWTLDINTGISFKSNLIHSLAAKLMIEEIQNETSPFHEIDGQPKKGVNLKREIIRLSKKYNIISEYTSFIAVSEQSNEQNTGEMLTKKIPIQKSQDYNYSNIRNKSKISQKSTSKSTSSFQNTKRSVNVSNQRKNMEKKTFTKSLKKKNKKDKKERKKKRRKSKVSLIQNTEILPSLQPQSTNLIQNEDFSSITLLTENREKMEYVKERERISLDLQTQQKKSEESLKLRIEKEQERRKEREEERKMPELERKGRSSQRKILQEKKIERAKMEKMKRTEIEKMKESKFQDFNDYEDDDLDDELDGLTGEFENKEEQPEEEEWEDDEEEVKEKEEEEEKKTSLKKIPCSIDDIVNAQSAKGFFNHSTKLAKLLDLKLSQIELSRPKDINNINVWTTILVICFLQKYFSNLKDEWNLVARKARIWIKKNSQVGDLQELIEQAEKII
ncbi:von willebrand factor a domain-containing protein 5a [Anaeramoeba flamelloides]|uniref:von willebrand factor a domain-containing protein 5a n=1 Tax=Anaeramoeba flamelloides TaxID=1746091 RepID=A0ABQ8Y183_9EUKA|nr:von willebrand factor a domain-containing protein 5a [Anaeramoeba flamelloides]